MSWQTCNARGAEEGAISAQNIAQCALEVGTGGPWPGSVTPWPDLKDGMYLRKPYDWENLAMVAPGAVCGQNSQMFCKTKL